MPALAKWAAIREPMVPAPSMATRERVRMNVFIVYFEDFKIENPA